MNDVVIFGAGGHARIVLDILSFNKEINVSAFCALNVTSESIAGVSVIDFDLALKKFSHGIVAIGENFTRQKVVNDILKINSEFKFINAIHPTAILAKNVQLQSGNVICAGVIINSGSTLSEHIIINTGSIVEHDCTIKKFASISPGAVLGGGCKIGVGSLVGIGSTLIHGVEIGNYSVCGAHSLVYNDIADNELHFGVPCKFIRKLSWGEKIL